MPKRGSRAPETGVWNGNGVIGGRGPGVGDGAWGGNVAAGDGVGGIGVGVDAGAMEGVALGGGAVGWQAHASSASTSTSRARSTVDSGAFRGQIEERRHFLVEHLSVSRFGR
jgi:hypothetical protein